ncbi:MAG: hypothetical protein ACREMC_02155 [Gemmatimonadales bacterium]
MKTTRRPLRSKHASGEAEQLATAIHALGNYRHVTVEAQRGLLYVHADEEPVARLTPLGRDQYGLSFHQHTGRWEPTPFTGDLAHLAGVLVSEFGAYLASCDFPPTKNGSAH